MYTKETKPTRVYKVVFEHLATGIQSYVFVEASSSYEASEGVLDSLGKDFDLILCIGAKTNDLN